MIHNNLNKRTGINQRYVTMLSRIEPEVGCWYEDMDRNVVFEVVCCDEDSVDIQYFEGEIEEIERETFLKMWLQLYFYQTTL